MSPILTIPAHTDFLRLLARGLLTGDKILGGGAPDMDQLHEATILLPTRRAVRLFSDILLQESPRQAVMLPTILPLGDLDNNLDDDLWMQTMPDIPPAIHPVERHMTLTALMQQSPVIKNPMGTHNTAVDLVAADLAGELANFIDLTDRYEALRTKLKNLAPEQFAEHWQITLELLNVIVKVWPGYLTARGLADPIARRNLMLRSFADYLEKTPPQAPVIIAGSTGSLPATGALFKAVAKFARGAIILPGLDLDMDENDWEAVDPAHPQYGLKNLLADMETSRDQVKVWGGARKTKTRDWLIRETLRPTQTTHCWAQNIRHPPADLSERLEEIKLIEADNLREEAGLIALMLRESLEQKNQTAALITHDRALARRVVAMLKIWDVDIDDAAGVRLTNLPAFVFLKLIAEAVISDFSPIAFLSCVKHPLAQGGDHLFRQKIREIELCALRGAAPQGLAGIKQKLRDKNLIAVMSRLEKIFAPFTALAKNPESNFIDCCKAHILCAENLAADESGAHDLWTHEAGQDIADHLREIINYGAALKKISVKTYPLLLDALFATAPVFRPRARLQSRLHIWSPLEARLQSPDLVILGALNEGVWPAPIAADPWLNREMRKNLGLPVPETQIGLAAHDFGQNLAAPRLVLTRARKGADGAPQQPSRWLLRLKNMLQGAGHQLHQIEKTDISQQLDQIKKISRRTIWPQPPLAAKPKQLSASALTKLVGDPYAFYAERILKLKPLEEIDEEPTPAERGLIIHDILERFAKKHHAQLPKNALDELIAIGRELFANASQKQIVRAFWQPRFEDMAQQFIALEKNTLRRDNPRILTEVEGQISLPINGEEIILTARADRIDIGKNGQCAIYDYKTGQVPAMTHVQDGLEPQLPLETIIARQGGFENMTAAQTECLAFIALKESSWENMLKEIPDVKTLQDKALKSIKKTLVQYLDDGWDSAPSTRKGSDYDHLSRIKDPSIEE